MESDSGRHYAIQDQENIHAVKRKGKVTSSVKRQGLSVRGALEDVDTNVQAQRDVDGGKVAVIAAEFEKKASLNHASSSKSNYGHVTSKVGTGFPAKNVQPLRGPKESMGILAARAAARTTYVLKKLQNKTVKTKESSSSSLLAKKVNQKAKKVANAPKEQSNGKENKELSKITIKDPTESLGNLKLAETNLSEKLHNVSISSMIQLPDDIEDIDASDKSSQLLMSVYIKDIYRYLRELEIKFPIEEEHLKKQIEITGGMRATLIDWLVAVQRQFSLQLETFHLTVGIIDRYLQKVLNVQRDRLQLIGVTAMYIASKYEETCAPVVGDFEYVAADTYTKFDVFQCERDILAKLGFCLARPTPLIFLTRFVNAAHGTLKHHHLSKYFVDLCLVEYAMAHYRPSELAAAAICLSLHLLSAKPLAVVWTPTLSYESEYSLVHIEPIIRKIAKVVINVENSNCKAVYNKYFTVSSLPQLRGEAINALVKSPSEC